MELTAELVAPCAPDHLFPWVEDLDRYPEWLGIVRRTERESAHPPAWIVDLRARVGPLSRAKRLRMQRTGHDRPRSAVFERREIDGREHGMWVLRAEVDPADGGSRLTMSLRYDGRWWGAALEGLLVDEIDRSKQRLIDLVTT